MQNALETLGFEQIRAQLAGCAATKWAQDKIAALAPHRSEARLTGASRDKRRADHPRLCRPAAAAGHAGGKDALTRAEKGGLLHAGGPASCAAFGAACKRLKAYLKKAETTGAGSPSAAA